MKKKVVVLLVIVLQFLFFCSRYSIENLPDKGIVILSPKANDVVPAGASCEIQWKAEVSDPEFGAVVTIEFSKDGGKSWEMVEENIPKAGKCL